LVFTKNMRILAFIDLHGSLSAWKKIKKKAKSADVIVCGGDFTIFEQGIEHFIEEFDNLKKPFLLIHGNHEEEELIRHVCHKSENLFFLHKKHFIKDDILFIGWGGGGFSQTDKEFEKYSKKFKELIDKHKDKAVVFLTHAPPYKTKLDGISKDHVGNKSFRNFIKENNIDLSISGHLHENEGKVDKINKSTVINPGRDGKIINL
jgi:Icc-related predicted phosphoesterase